jgi:hypothetical protein
VCLDRGREASGSTERNGGVAFSVFAGASSANADRSPHRRPSGEKGGNDDNRAYQETEADQLLLIHRAHRWDAVVVGPRGIMLLNSIYNSPHP